MTVICEQHRPVSVDIVTRHQHRRLQYIMVHAQPHTNAHASSSTSHPAAGSPRYIDDGYIELLSVIGTGAYGVVYLALDGRYRQPDGQPTLRAVKCLRRYGLDERQRHFQRREIALHRLASGHPSIITMNRLLEEGDWVYMVMDYGDEGDLFAMIIDKQRVCRFRLSFIPVLSTDVQYVGYNELVRSVFLQLVDGVRHLHHLGIAHRDIKPENIVCSEDGTRVRICDFGLATSETTSNEFGCGSTFYIAPECLGDWFPKREAYSTPTGDVWSLGVILVNLVCGRNPWRIASPSDESFNSFVKDPAFLRRILPISEQCLYVLKRIFTIEPSERITIDELRDLILQVEAFTMDEEELLAAHYAAQRQSAAPSHPHSHSHPYNTEVSQEDWQCEEEEEDDADEGVFAFDDDLDLGSADGHTPSLRGDTQSPTPIPRSRSESSNGGSLPPTPLLGCTAGVIDASRLHIRVQAVAAASGDVWLENTNAKLDDTNPAMLGINIRTQSPEFAPSSTVLNPYFP